MEVTKIVKEYYDSNVLKEWTRIENRPEFIITCRIMDRYINPGDKILDIGGGPGRYSFYFMEKGCDVTLFDLSSENISFAQNMSKEKNMNLKTHVGDARVVSEIVEDKFDHILIMGPMYHVLEEKERKIVVENALKLLKPGGIIFISFINLIAGIIYAMKFKPEIILDSFEQNYHKLFIENKNFSGEGFTQTYFSRPDEILYFMSGFNLEKLHLISQESILTLCEDNIFSQSKEVIDLWIDLGEKLCEREDLLSWGEHLMYIGKNKSNEI